MPELVLRNLLLALKYLLALDYFLCQILRHRGLIPHLYFTMELVGQSRRNPTLETQWSVPCFSDVGWRVRNPDTSYEAPPFTREI